MPTRIYPLLLLLAIAAAYANSFRGDFLLDDREAIIVNPFIRSLWPLTQAMTAPPQSTVAGRPVVSLSLAVNYALGGLHPFGYHLVNLLVHAANALLLFGLTRRLLRAPLLRPHCGLAADGLALSLALLWALHPLQTESVTYVVQRAESLLGLFFLLTAYTFVRGAVVESSLPPGARMTHGRRIAWPILAVAACAVGMATKETMVVCPSLVLLLDRLLLAGGWREALRRRWKTHAALHATWLVLAMLMWHSPRSQSAGFSLASVTPWTYLLTQFEVVTHYLRLCIWPDALCLDYGWPIARSAADVWPQALFILMPAAITVAAVLRGRPAGMLGAWFFLALAPTSSVVPIADAAFEHRMYLPLAAVVLAAVLGVHRLLTVVKAGSAVPRLLLAAAALALGLRTFDRNRDYTSAQRMWEDVADRRPGNPRAWAALGDLAGEAGDTRGAVAHYERALSLNENYIDVLSNLGSLMCGQGLRGEGLVMLEKAVALQPDHADAHNNLAIALEQEGRLDEAINHYQRATACKPGFAAAHYNLALALIAGSNADPTTASDRLRMAAAQLREVLRWTPENTKARQTLARVLNNLAVHFHQQGNDKEAILHWEQALAVQPDFETHFNLAFVHAELGDRAAALRHLEAAEKLHPNQPQLLELRSKLLGGG